MKKIMLLMAAALVSLSACSKSANEPVVKNQDDEVVESINLTIEGEREDVSVLDENGRALNLTGSAQGSVIKGLTLKDGTVEGIIYVYSNKNSHSTADEKKGFGRKVTFNVHNNKISFRGPLATGRLQRKQLPYLKMDVYIGGRIKRSTIEPDGVVYPRGGGVEYFPSTKAVRTEDGMDLSVCNPIFYSKGLPVTPAKDGQTQDYYSTGHKFKLYGEFVSFRFRMTNSAQARFNGFLVRGFGIGGVSLDEPAQKSGYAPAMTVARPSATDKTGTFIGFPDAKTYYIKGDGQAPFENPAQPNVKTEAAYTLYLFTPAEDRGGVRMGFSGTPNIFLNNTGNNANNLPGYWGESVQDPYHSTSKNYGKFHNLVLLLRRK